MLSECSCCPFYYVIMCAFTLFAIKCPITPAKKVMFLPGLSVRLFVCKQHNSKTYGRILIKLSGYVQNGKRKK